MKSFNFLKNKKYLKITNIIFLLLSIMLIGIVIYFLVNYNSISNENNKPNSHQFNNIMPTSNDVVRKYHNYFSSNKYWYDKKDTTNQIQYTLDCKSATLANKDMWTIQISLSPDFNSKGNFNIVKKINTLGDLNNIDAANISKDVQDNGFWTNLPISKNGITNKKIFTDLNQYFNKPTPFYKDTGDGTAIYLGIDSVNKITVKDKVFTIVIETNISSNITINITINKESDISDNNYKLITDALKKEGFISNNPNPKITKDMVYIYISTYLNGKKWHNTDTTDTKVYTLSINKGNVKINDQKTAFIATLNVNSSPALTFDISFVWQKKQDEKDSDVLAQIQSRSHYKLSA